MNCQSCLYFAPYLWMHIKYQWKFCQFTVQNTLIVSSTKWDMATKRGPIIFQWILILDCYKSYHLLGNVLEWSAKSFALYVWATLPQDGSSSHHSSDPCFSLIGNIGFTSEIGSVNQWSPKWKYSRGRRLAESWRGLCKEA